jgi:predicted O-linked N-acetylglucosamine transferase (SPINDLY family)
LHYLKAYNDVDIGLDPFPYNGGTTSLDSLWMGVPFITLEGSAPAARGGVSVLRNAGLGELIASTPTDYIRKAKELAEDHERLRILRSGMRQRIEASPLSDITRFARDMENMYRDWWLRWCEAN